MSWNNEIINCPECDTEMQSNGKGSNCVLHICSKCNYRISKAKRHGITLHAPGGKRAKCKECNNLMNYTPYDKRWYCFKCGNDQE